MQSGSGSGGRFSGRYPSSVLIFTMQREDIDIHIYIFLIHTRIFTA